MYARKHPRARKAGNFVGLAMILGMMVLAAPPHASPALAVPAQAWTAYVVNSGSNSVTPFNTATNTAGPPSRSATRPWESPSHQTGPLRCEQLGDGTVTPINTATNTAGPPIVAGITPTASPSHQTGPLPTSRTPLVMAPSHGSIRPRTPQALRSGRSATRPQESPSHQTGLLRM